mgnify:CR=1 FL=1
MACSGLHCAGCAGGITVPVVSLAAAFGLAWIAEHLIEVIAEVDLADVLEYDQPMSPAIIDACADLFAAEGHRWIAFYEHGSTDGLDPVFASLIATTKQYVFLGEVPIPAERDDPARRR